MEPKATFPLYTLRRAVKQTCLIVALFCGLLAVGSLCFVTWQISTWRAPSIQTRKQVEADMPKCSLNSSELPDGWYRLWADSFVPYEKVLPGRALGGISTGFAHDNTNAARPASHSILFYRTNFHAAFAYRMHRLGIYNSRFYPTWEPLDLTQTNLSADEYHAACSEFMPDIGPGQGDYTCRSKARYGQFVSRFDTAVSSRDMSVEEMIQLVQALDKHMLACVDSYANKTWEEE